MRKRLILTATVVATLGQGCLPPVTAPTAPDATSTRSALGEPSPEGLVGFKMGFGKLPGAAPSSGLPAGPRPSIVLGADIPVIPPDVTVLRERKTAPDEILLQNITSAARVPAGTLGRAPSASALTLRWRDDQGYRWTYDAALHRVGFDRITGADTATVSQLLQDDRLIQTAKAFLDERGALTRGWGKPELSFSWFKWWERALGENRCMNDAALGAVRELGKKGDADVKNAPLLPFRDSGARCVNPEFPTLQAVDYAATRDEQLVLNDRGESIFAAHLVVNVKDGTVQSGWFELPTDLDRSNYPALSANETLERLRAGGLNPITGSSPGVTITLNSFVIGLHKHTVTADDQPRSYFLPALWARGTVRRADGSTTGYATLVPLVRDDAFTKQ
ncbi:MAG TPA: hypothetical protein VN397_01390 [Candidatus Methylomirabilis sp.]|nr:hypothetical protein [Candidatus Methylomirabilis sp.]